MENSMTGRSDGAGAGNASNLQSSASTGDGQGQGIKQSAVRGAQNLIDRAQSQVRTRADEQRRAAAQTLTSVAHHLQESSTELRSGQYGIAGEYIGRAAEQLDRAARYVENTEVDQIVGGVERFARRQPAVFLGAAFALGILGARFLKSSGSRAYDVGETVPVRFADREVSTTIETESVGGTTGIGGTGPGTVDEFGLAASPANRPVGGGNS